MKRILVIDDHRMIGSSMALLFKHAKPEVDVDIAVSMDKAYPFLEQNGTYDLVLLDYDLPRIDGLAGLKSIKEKYPEQKVCMLSGISAPNIVYACIHHGAVGWISKTMHEKQLIHAILMMAAGGEFIPADVLTIINKYQKKWNTLTDKETEVAELLCKGHSDKDIANEFGISPRTVQNHVRALLKKADVDNRTKFVDVYKSTTHFTGEVT